MTNFKGNNELISALSRNGFRSFGPGHSSRNGYDIIVNDKGRRACFYDNSLWGKSLIEFTVMDYGKKDVFKHFMFGLYLKSQDTNFSIFTLYFESSHIFTDKEIKLLIDISKEMK